MPKENDKVKEKFLLDTIEQRKNLEILYDESFKLINMDETARFLNINSDTTIEFTGKKNVEIITSGSEKYRISVILAVTGDGYKLPPFIIIKGEEGKRIEKNLQKFPFMQRREMYVYCQKEGWCTTQIFSYWLKEVYLPYQKFIWENCLLILDNSTTHNSKESLKILKEYNVNYSFIPPGMTPECQPLDISVNRIFKSQIKQKFEENRLFFDEKKPKIKLQNARLNLLDFIYQIWYDDNIITKFSIINGFKSAGLINKFYLSIEEEKTNKLYLYDLIRDDKIEFIDDLGNELNISDKDFDFNNNHRIFSDEDELITENQIIFSENNETFMDKKIIIITLIFL